MATLENSGNEDVAVAMQDVLKRMLGEERFSWWMTHNLEFETVDGELLVYTSTRFYVERLQKRLLLDLQQAAKEVYGTDTPVRIRCAASRTNNGQPSNPTVSQPQSLPGLDDHEPVKQHESGPPPADQHTAERKTAERKTAERKTAERKTAGPRVRRSADAEPQRLITEPQKLITEPNLAIGQNPVSGRRAAISGAEPSENGTATTVSRSSSTSLENFVVGECNQLASVATKMLLDKPGSPSPLFFWGPAGSGKTHLLAAIRNGLKNQHRMRRVVMLSAEQFTNDFLGAVRGSGLPGFRRRYRDVDALLIDDVQFVGGKRATLRELQYTVDSLLRGRCQLAFTADRPPLELEGLIEELSGRFAGGMVCPLKPLDRATRLGVLRGLAEAGGTEVLPGVLEKLADELAGDGRILSGALNHLRTLSQMLGHPATWDELLRSAPDLIAAGRPAVNLHDIQKAVCDMFGLEAGSLSSRGQHRAVSEPRMLAMYLARRYTRAAYSEIGEYFGHRSHSTVIAANKRVEGWINENVPLRRGAQSLPPRQAIEAIENLIRTG